MKTKLLIIALAASGILGLSSCGSIEPGSPTHYVVINNRKGGVKAVR
jgi:hypothetical protein